MEANLVHGLVNETGDCKMVSMIPLQVTTIRLNCLNHQAATN